MSTLETLIQEYSQDNLSRFFRQSTQASGNYRDLNEDISPSDPKHFSKGKLIGDLTYEKGKLAIVAYSATGELTEKSSRRAQFEEAKNLLKQKQSYSLGGIFVFADDKGNFRFSFIYWQYSGKKRIPNSYTRCTHFVSTELTNKTFEAQLASAKWADYQSLINQTFSIQAITKAFYNEFYNEYKSLADSIKVTNSISQSQAENFALLFVIRLIFLGFVQKRRWLGNDTDFIRKLWHLYQKDGKAKETFYSEWLSPLFFKALSGPRDRRQFSFTHLPASTINDYKDAPYLNGGLFRTNTLVDSFISHVSDVATGKFIDYLFNYNFTIEENSYNDADLELNPEFLGIIFERLVNKADGAVYTPRVEVDLMCKLSLSNWLAKNTSVPLNQLYQLFFREEEERGQTRGDLSQSQKDEILAKLKNITVCDPAVGSGAFPVGMLTILTETMQYLYISPNRKPDSDYNIKKGIIEKSLYGVEVKEWAVWITQLRLWIALFVDAPDSLRDQDEPILPSLDFKIRRGDSLVQLLGSKLMSVKFDQFDINLPTLDKLKKVAQAKSDYFFNKSSAHDPHSIRLSQIAILHEYLESEEHELKSKLIRAKIPSIGSNQQSLLLDEPKQTTISFSATPQEIDTLEQNIKQVQVQLKDIRNIADNKHKEIPFIWGLEFSEIFYGPKQGFDLVIGNPPYVRQEDIADPNEIIADKKEYKNLLAEMVKHDFTSAFPPKSKINAQSDLYTYFYIRGLKLLNQTGIETYICSNSWLDVGYGVWLQKFLLEHTPAELVIDNHAKRSFGEAEVNTIISVIHAPQEKVDPDHLTRFIAFKKPFEEVVNSNNLIGLTTSSKILSTDDFRVYPISTKMLLNAGTEYADDDHMAIGTYVGDKWGGKYLRAPDIFIKLMLDNNFTKLKTFAEVGGYIHDNNTGNKYPAAKFLKSIKSTRKILVDDLTKGLVAYGVKDDGNSRIVSPILIARTYSQDHLIIYNKGQIFGKEFYKIIPKNNENIEQFVLWLNSSLFILIRELYGITNLGGGGLKFSGDDVRMFPTPDLNILKINQEVFNKFISRDIESIFIELGFDPSLETSIEEQEPNPLPDRAELDKIVFDALDLTQDERKEVYRAVCRLVWNRISKAKSV